MPFHMNKECRLKVYAIGSSLMSNREMKLSNE